MKKSVLFLSLATVGIATLATAQSELRPLQKAMQARAAWMKAMNQNLAASHLAEVGKAAAELSTQTAKVAGGAEGERKLLTQKISDLAKEISEAADKGDEAIVKAKLGDIKATCTDCHDKFRK